MSRLKKFILISVTSVGVFIIVLYGTGNDPYGRKVGSTHGRIGLYKAATYSTFEKPFFGLGHKQFEKNSVVIKDKYQILEKPEFSGHAHNNYLEAFADLGLIGGSFFILWLVFGLSRVAFLIQSPELLVSLPLILVSQG